RWEYKVTLPDIMERTRYVRTMVHVLLLELATRNAPARAPEIPAWLDEGLSGQLLAASGPEIILSPPRASATGVLQSSTFKGGRREGPLEQAHRVVRGQAALTFEQLSWPAEEQWTANQAEFYRCNAQVFVSELQGLPNGRQSLLEMVRALPQYY